MFALHPIALASMDLVHYCQVCSFDPTSESACVLAISGQYQYHSVPISRLQQVCADAHLLKGEGWQAPPKFAAATPWRSKYQRHFVSNVLV